MKSKKTREKILDTSLELFNSRKASNVSTVQISAAMKISPGNLYYYYANKEDVIRCIWEERMADRHALLMKKTETINTPKELLEYIEECFAYMIEYRFFYTELSTLFANDEELIDVYEGTVALERDSLTALVVRLSEADLFVEGAGLDKVMAVQNAVAAAIQMVGRYDAYMHKNIGYDEFIGYCLIRIVYAFDNIMTDKMKEIMDEELSAIGYPKEKYMETIK